MVSTFDDRGNDRPLAFQEFDELSHVNPHDHRRCPALSPVISIVLCVVAGCLTGLSSVRATSQRPVNTAPTSRPMPDGRRWTTENLNIKSDGSYCYDDAQVSCDRYGRLYTWEGAREGCRALGERWRLPTDDEWRQLAKHYGGIIEDSKDDGRAAYLALMTGGRSGFDALLGGNRSPDAGLYERREAHGFYWTATESAATTAWFYNLGRGGAAVNRHQGSKQMAISVRCVSDLP